ncbi:MAG: 4-(cytidine 5'-diphospho)-2-C-methyl-D-erythritol kinase [Planctomycetaceae bacterium]
MPALHAPPAQWIALVAPAKLNLSLAVLARRPDGYHDIESLMGGVTLGDGLAVRATAEPGFRLAVRYGPDLAATPLARDVPAGRDNLVVRAAEALAAAAGVERGLEIDLVKRVPAGAGLGGGSSDAAEHGRGAARAWGLDWSRERLAAIGATIGSDVPFFLGDGPAIAGGRGERLEPVAGMPPLPAVIACPATGLSTAAVYAACVPDPARRGNAMRLATALTRGDLRGAVSWLSNALEAPARRLCPDVDRLLAAMSAAGAVGPRLTGSGSACFALARTATEARGIAARLTAARGPDGGRLWPGVFTVRLVTAAGGVATG